MSGFRVNDVAAFDHNTIIRRGGTGIVVDREVATSSDGANAHASRNHRSVRCHTAQFCEDTFRGFHAMDIFRGGFASDEYYLITFCRLNYCFISGENDGTCGATRGGG